MVEFNYKKHDISFILRKVRNTRVRRRTDNGAYNRSNQSIFCYVYWRWCRDASRCMYSVHSVHCRYTKFIGHIFKESCMVIFAIVVFVFFEADGR